MKRYLSIAVSFLALVLLAWGDNVGPGSAGATSTGSPSWTGPTNVHAEDGVFATVGIGADVASGSLYIRNLGFAVPSGATINGIVVTFKRKCSSMTSGGCGDDSMRLTKSAGVGVGSNRTAGVAWSTTNTTVTYGSSVDLWGTTWTDTEVNAAGFGAIFAAYNFNMTSSRTASVDYFAVTVYYTPSGGGGGGGGGGAGPSAIPSTPARRPPVISQTRTIPLPRRAG